MVSCILNAFYLIWSYLNSWVYAVILSISCRIGTVLDRTQMGPNDSAENFISRDFFAVNECIPTLFVWKWFNNDAPRV